jgi:hypothetical protein
MIANYKFSAGQEDNMGMAVIKGVFEGVGFLFVVMVLFVGLVFLALLLVGIPLLLMTPKPTLVPPRPHETQAAPRNWGQ